MTEHVKTEVAAGIMTLTLARPDKMNALSNAMYSAMSDGLERAEKDPAVRRKNHDELRRTAEDPKLARAFLLRSSLIESLREAEQIP